MLFLIAKKLLSYPRRKNFFKTDHYLFVHHTQVYQASNCHFIAEETSPERFVELGKDSERLAGQVLTAESSGPWCPGKAFLELSSYF